mmetsp:Transcript_29046/g.43807  ORF Transcript_29046/g.43807 Transcript_29046/m.43807 type:complete len:92 (+) Transcript_29046:523-798(+)
MYEDRIANINKSNSGLYEQTNKLKQEVAKLKGDLKVKQVECDELHTRLSLLSDVDKQLMDFRQQLAEKERMVQSLRAQLDEALAKNQGLVE